MTEVLFFARAREVAGTSRQVFEGETVAEIISAAVDRFGPELAEVCATASFVVDGEMILRSELATAHPGSEMAVLPPVSGGA